MSKPQGQSGATPAVLAASGAIPGMEGGAIDVAVLQRVMSRGPVTFAEIPAPSLDGLSVEVSATQDPGSEEILDRFDELILERAPRKERQPGERIELGDHVVADLVAFSQGQLLPDSSAEGAEFWLTPEELEDGLAQALAGAAVGSNVQVKLTLPNDYPVESLRGEPAVFAVRIRSAESVAVPDGDPEDPAYLKALELPEEVDVIYRELAEEAFSEREIHQQQYVLQEAFTELVRRSPAKISDTDLDTISGGLWREQQGQFLTDLKVDDQSRATAAKVWLDDPRIRDDVRRNLQILLVLQALAREHKVTLTDAEFVDAVASLAENIEVDRKTVEAELKTDVEMAAFLRNQILVMRTLDLILSKVDIRVISARE